MYFKHAKTDDIFLALQIIDPATGLGVVGATPQVAIRRARASQGGGPLDNWYWDGVGFSGTPTWHTLTPVDAVNTPGIYTYLFEQSLVAGNIVYLMYFRNTTPPVGFAVEEHTVTDELFIPVGSGVVPVIPGDTVMGRLAAMEVSTGAVARANADAVWDEVLAGHLTPGSTGAALAACSAGEVGAREIEIYLDDQHGAPIVGAQVDVFDAADLVFIGRQHTAVDGLCTFALDDGSYNLRLFASGVAFVTPQPFVVVADALLSFEGTRLYEPIVPSDPNKCVIFGWVRDAAGVPVAGACCGAYARTPQDVQGATVNTRIAHIETDADGYFEMELLRGAEVVFEIEATGLSINRVVPDADFQDLTTWTD
jgi:hypothetical protein